MGQQYFSWANGPMLTKMFYINSQIVKMGAVIKQSNITYDTAHINGMTEAENKSEFQQHT